MPPRRRNSPPVDPFPPLRRAGTSSSSSTPSYASIAARSSHPQESEHEPLDQHRNIPYRGSYSAEERAWAVDDVDRQDNLDELNIYAEPIDIHPSPPWRSRQRRGQTTHNDTTENAVPESETEPQAGPSTSRGPLVGTPSSSAQNRTNAVANGARNPTSQEEGVSTPPQIPSRPSNYSPPSPSPNRPTRNEPSPDTHLAPMFTLEELLRSQPPRTEEPSSSSSNTNSRPTGQTVRAVLADRIRNVRDSPNWGMRMERALPAGAGDRTIGRDQGWTSRSDLDAVLDILNENTTDPVVVTIPPDDPSTSNRTFTRTSTRPLDGSATNASQSITSFLRRRRRNPAPASNVTMTWNPEEVLPFDHGSSLPPSSRDAVHSFYNDNNNESDEDEDEESWRASRLRIHNFTDGDSEFDVDGPVQTQTSGRSGLHRGGNNRRRRSLLARIGAPPDLRFPEDFEEPVDFLPPTRTTTQATGCEPTNRDTAANIVPLVVRSGGTTRPREDEKEGNWSPLRKKRKIDSPVNETHYSLPTYLNLSTLPRDTPLPTEFFPPLNRSHLALSTFKSNTHPPRSLITFVGYNPTRTDEDATSLHATIPIPIECGIHYYEVEVIDKGEEGFMSVGWMKKGSNLRRLVGWDKGSWGWHGDDGRSFEGQGSGERFSQTWTTADIVGCGIDYTTGRAFFTKNGKLLGHRFSNLPSGLHPAIGLRSVGESLAINFTGPFQFDIDSYVKSTKDGIWQDIKSTQVEEVPRLVDQVQLPESTSKSSKIAQDDNQDVGVSKKPAKAALAQALQKELKEIEVDTSNPDSSKEITTADHEKPTPRANQLDPIDRTSSAFVLDFLLQNGHTKALSLSQSGMVKKGQLRTSKPVSAADKDESSSTKPSSEKRLSDFHSKQEALVWLHQSISTSFENPLPSSLLKDLSSADLPKSIQAQMEIYDFLHLLHLSTGPSSGSKSEMDTEGDVLETVLEKGRYLRNEMNTWDSGEKVIAEKVFGLLVEPENLKNDEFWIGKRKEWANGLVKSLRDINGLNQVSNLEQALRQTHVVLKALTKKSGKSGAAFVDLKQVLKN